MKCLKCGKESKREFCRECKEVKHNAITIISQNKKKLIKLLYGDWLTPEGFEKFILYTSNILKYGKIYMEYKNIKRDKVFKGIINIVWILGGCIALRGGISIMIIKI